MRFNWLSILLVVIGIWLLTNTLVGDLPGKILSWGPK